MAALQQRVAKQENRGIVGGKFRGGGAGPRPSFSSGELGGSGGPALLQTEKVFKGTLPPARSLLFNTCHSFTISEQRSGNGVIIRGAMDIKERELFTSLWQIVLRQNELLQMMLPTTHDVARCLMEGRKPIPQQVDAWTELNKRVTQEMLDINEALAELQRSVDPLFGYNS